MFFSNYSLVLHTAKLFHLEQFALYGRSLLIYGNNKCKGFVLLSVFLNQAFAGHRGRHAPGFLELLLSANVCMRVCVSPRGY